MSNELPDGGKAGTDRYRASGFRKELEHLINRCSLENESDTPDFILADYLTGCLSLFDQAVRRRSQWGAIPAGPEIDEPQP